MARQHLEANQAELTINQSEKKYHNARESEAIKPKKYHVKISMIKSYEVVDFWTKKPEALNVFELFMNELSTINLTKYFKFEVSEI